MSKRNRWDVSNKPAQPTTTAAHSAAHAAAAAIAARINEAVAALQQKIEPPESKIFSEGYIQLQVFFLKSRTAHIKLTYLGNRCGHQSQQKPCYFDTEQHIQPGYDHRRV
jgi:hypothetical protein